LSSYSARSANSAGEKPCSSRASLKPRPCGGKSIAAFGGRPRPCEDGSRGAFGGRDIYAAPLPTLAIGTRLEEGVAGEPAARVIAATQGRAQSRGTQFPA